MNHTCQGDIFQRWGKRWGRCFGGSTMFEFREGTEVCPICKRPWDGIEKAEDFNPSLSEEVMIQIDIPQYKFMIEQKDEKIKRLEAELETWKTMYKKEVGITSF